MPPLVNDHFKYLTWAGILTLGLLSLFIVTQIDATVNRVDIGNSVSFTGEGRVLAKPDVATVNLSIVTEALNSQDAQNQNTKKSQTVVAYLNSQGIDEKDVRTINYNIYPQYSYPNNDKPEIRGYQVNQGMEVKIRDLAKVSSILDGVVGAGVNQVDSLQFKIDDPDKLMAEAREKAIDDAKMKASELRDTLGIRLGRLVNFSESTGGYPVPYAMYDRAMGAGAGGGPSIPTGENEVVISVVLTYQIR